VTTTDDLPLPYLQPGNLMVVPYPYLFCPLNEMMTMWSLCTLRSTTVDLLLYQYPYLYAGRAVGPSAYVQHLGVSSSRAAESEGRLQKDIARSYAWRGRSSGVLTVALP
jgi:hypothetical protein